MSEFEKIVEENVKGKHKLPDNAKSNLVNTIKIEVQNIPKKNL